MRQPTRSDYINAINRAAARPKSQKQIQAEGRAAKIALAKMDAEAIQSTTPVSAAASPSAGIGVEHSVKGNE